MIWAAMKPRGLSWLGLALVLNLAPYATRFPPWLLLICALLIGWRFLVARPASKPRSLHKAAQQIGILLLLLGLVIYYRTWLGPQIGLSMLALLCGFKILEARQGRDIHLLVFMNLFLLLGNFLSSQSIGALLHALLVLLLLCTALFAHHDRGASLGRMALLAGGARTLLLAIPLAVTAFLLFPRFSGPLWGRAPNSGTAVTGLSETMEPGSIIQVIHSREPILRAEFHGAVPERGQLYWRGPVMWWTDGRSWSQGKPTSPATPARVTPLGPPVQYTIVQEGTEQRRLFALELPAHAPQQLSLSPDMQLIAPSPLRGRVRQQITSYVSYIFLGLDKASRRRGLQLPPDSHPQSRALARQWRQETTNSRQLVNRALDYFRTQNFVYTLSPRALPGDNIDTFLFETREGFCEHYAAAFVVLMRAAGIPARIVTGYQGGTFNPLGNYYIVRQSDAHAWAEVWLDQRIGWVRVDPVAAVSPERIQAGMDEVLSSLSPPEQIEALLAPLAAGRWMQSLRHLLDSAGYQWSKWVLGYDSRTQRQLLELLHLESFGNQALYGLLAIGLGTLLLLFFLALRRSTHRTPGVTEEARRHYDLFQRRLALAGVDPLAYEGPLDYAARAQRLCPGMASQIQGITATYVRVRYGGDHAALSELRRLVRACKPKRLAPRRRDSGQ